MILGMQTIKVYTCNKAKPNIKPGGCNNLLTLLLDFLDLNERGVRALDMQWSYSITIILFRYKAWLKICWKFLKGVTTGPYERFFTEELLCKRIFLRNENFVRICLKKLTKNQENLFFYSMSHNFKL